MDIMDVSAGTFVEYQRDGTWTEACAARMYSIEKMGLKEIALDERPDPEVHRVHDADVELRLVRWVGTRILASAPRYLSPFADLSDRIFLMRKSITTMRSKNERSVHTANIY